MTVAIRRLLEFSPVTTTQLIKWQHTTVPQSGKRAFNLVIVAAVLVTLANVHLTTRNVVCLVRRVALVIIAMPILEIAW